MKNTIKIGVIGAGAFAGYHLLGLQQVECAEVVAICDTDISRAKARAEMIGIDTVYDNYHDLLAREDIDAVTLPLPDQIHRQITVDALKAGKHVLCEKPMALSLDDCKAMVKAAEESGKQLMVGQIGRYTPSFVKAKEIYDSGMIGELFFI